ncbi:MAG: hypothetical protein NTZ42_00130 [Candidatus Gribaldobacteria bacterium]|nr:hypothetical protein [Candidatus Gribaldobacteria bacterium]
MNKKIFFKQISKKVAAGLIFGVAMVAGIAITLAFTEPTAGPSGSNEPANVREKGASLYPGRGWLANAGAGDGSTALTKIACEAAYSSNNYRWQWFEDANGDGDTTDGEDGMCVLMCTGSGCTNTANYSNVAYLSASWNGAEQMSVSAAAASSTGGGTVNSLTKTSAGWALDAYKNSIVKITAGTAVNCWGLVKTNTADTITVYGSWLNSSYVSCGGGPDSNSTFQIYQDNMYDNSWIGDWTCSSNFPTGAVVWGSYPTTAQVGANLIALATADCLDGKRDLLPNESDRAVITSTATAGTSGLVLEDTSLALDVNTYMGQKIKITSGASINSTGTIESNTATTFTVSSWSSGAPSSGNTYQVIYVTPFASYQPNTSICGSTSCIKHNKGPLTTGNLNDWKGTRLPTSMDFFGVCGNGSAKKIIGNYGSQNGRTDEYLNQANDSVWGWLSEPDYYSGARVAGGYGCSYIAGGYVNGGYRFRAIFRP